MFFNPISYAKDSGRIFSLTNLKADTKLVIRGKKMGKEKPHPNSKTVVLESVPFDLRELHLIYGLDGSAQTHAFSGYEGDDILIDGKSSRGGVNLNTSEHTITWTTNCGVSTRDVRVEIKIHFHPEHGTLSLTYHAFSI